MKHDDDDWFLGDDDDDGDGGDDGDDGDDGDGGDEDGQNISFRVFCNSTTTFNYAWPQVWSTTALIDRDSPVALSHVLLGKAPAFLPRVGGTPTLIYVQLYSDCAHQMFCTFRLCRNFNYAWPRGELIIRYSNSI